MYGFYKTTIVAALFAACSVLLSTAITAEPRSTPRKDAPTNSIVLPTSSTGILSQCGDYYTFNPEETSYGVIPEAYDKNYMPAPPVTVPVYGFMADTAFPVEEAIKLKQGDNPYNTAEINRALWDGHSFIWMDKKANPETYTYVQNYANDRNKTHEKKLIVLTWTGAATLTEIDGKTIEKRLPMSREFAFSSWNISQSCMTFSEAADIEFMNKATELNTGRDIKTLPLATLDEDGSLPK